MNITPSRTVVLYAIATATFLACDLVWLGLVARGFYQRHLGYLMRNPVNWTAALVFYLLFVVGLLIFAIKPALEVQQPLRALLYGALFGFFTYATYDLTNLATVRDWPLIVSVVDLTWGVVLCTIVAGATYGVAVRLW
ncbi:MAG: DUF2177 family protein [Bacteroidales bacterium]